MWEALAMKVLWALGAAVATQAIRVGQAWIKELGKAAENNELLKRLRLDDALLAAAEDAIAGAGSAVVKQVKELTSDGDLDAADRQVLKELIERRVNVFLRTHGVDLADAVKADMIDMLLTRVVQRMW